MTPSCSKPQPIGLILKLGDKSTRAFFVGRQVGMRRAASDALKTINSLLDELAEERGLVAKLEAELDRERRRYTHAREMLRSTNRVVAMYERRDGVTLH